ncbi:MAG: threonine ammonia-lyase [Syntrophothermus sp.]
MPPGGLESGRAAPAGLGLEEIGAAHRASLEVVRHTPLLTSASISDRCGGEVALKAECLQRTGSFKLRGAMNKLRALGDRATAGVVAGSAGNHGQALAYAARSRGVPCAVFMPEEAVVSKVEAVRAFGAEVRLSGDSVDAAVEAAREHAEGEGMTFVHPFDDLDVIAGQGGAGLEIAADAERLACVVVPVGGGGLVSGVALAIKQADPAVRVVGVQAAACAAVVAAVRGGEARAPVPTIADGIAVKRPGELTLPLIEDWVDDLVTVEDESIAAAMVLLLSRSKLLVEGAGAASLAALLDGSVAAAEGGTTVALLSGGNVDIGLVASIAAHAETRAGRRSRLYTRVDDRPGALARLLSLVAEAHANVIAVEHVRDGVPRAVGETGIELVVETGGDVQRRQLLAALEESGYEIEVE